MNLGGWSFNWADLILAALLAAFALAGWRNGLIRMGFRLCSFAAALLLAWFLCPVLAEQLQNTPLYQGLLDRITPRLSQLLSGELTARLFPQAGEALAAYGAQALLRLLSFLALLAAGKLLLMAVGHLLNLFASLPVIGFLNRLAGMAAGILEGGLVACILLAAVWAIAPLREAGPLEDAIGRSAVVGTLYRQNPLLNLALPNQETNPEPNTEPNQ